jgi:hypothetical protein
MTKRSMKRAALSLTLVVAAGFALAPKASAQAQYGYGGNQLLPPDDNGISDAQPGAKNFGWLHGINPKPSDDEEEVSPSRPVITEDNGKRHMTAPKPD